MICEVRFKTNVKPELWLKISGVDVKVARLINDDIAQLFIEEAKSKEIEVTILKSLKYN